MASDGRPRVLILGGGFAGVGAAQKLEKADADVVLVDRHDYHTFQPLLYQLATGLLETTAVGHSLRDLLSRHDNTTIHKAQVTRDRPREADRRVRGDRADLLRLPRLRPRRRGQLLRHRRRARSRLPDVHASPCGPLQGPPARALGGRRPRSEPDRGRRSQRGRGRRRADRSRDGRRARRALPGRLREGLSGRGAGGREGDPRRGRAGALRDVQAEAAGVRPGGAHQAGRRGEDG